MSGPGRFITLEGGEGTGKSTLIAGLERALSARGQKVVVTREPGGTKLAEAVRNLALHPPEDEAWSPLAHALLMNTARDDHLRNLIRPALARGAWVICDRFADSTRAYQSIDGVNLDQLLAIEEIVVGETRPDLTLILDAAPADLEARRQDRNVSDVFEKKDLSFHEKVRSAFLAIAEKEPERCTVLNALQSPESLLSDALSVIDRKLALA